MGKPHNKRMMLAGLLLWGVSVFGGCAYGAGNGGERAGTEPQTQTPEDEAGEWDEADEWEEALPPPAPDAGEARAGEAAEERDFSDCYYYSSLTDGQQRLVYGQLFRNLTQMGQEVTVGCRDEEELDRIFQCVLADHPELFYVTGYTYTKYMQNDDVVKLSFLGTYSMTEAEADRCRSGIDGYVDVCLSGMPQGDDYAKIRYLYEYLIGNTEYSLQAPENQNMCSVFLYGQSVCQGYAKAFQYLCGRAGIDATLVTGKIRESGYGHAWNLVRSDGEYYYVDVTWGDASYTINGEQAQQGIPGVSYEYLCVTTDQIERTHEIGSVVEMPYCSATKDNYYVRENAYFTEFDEALLPGLFAGKENSFVTFQCRSEEVYRQYEEYLIGQEHIFDYMDASEGISYSDNRDTLTFGFWPPQN